MAVANGISMISINATIAAVLLRLGRIFTLKEGQNRVLKAFLGGPP